MSDYGPPALENLLHAANEAQRAGNIGRAVDLCREAITKNPGHAQAFNNLGALLNLQGDLHGALESFRRAAELDPGYALAHYNHGTVLQSVGRGDEAAQALRRAIDVRPDFAEAYGNLASILKEQGRLEEAVESCRRAVELKPDLAEAHNTLGLTYKAQGHLAKAEASFRHAASVRPGFVEALNNLGELLVILGQYQAAFECYEQAIAAHPGYAPTYRNLGLALESQGKIKDASANYQKAIELSPGFCDAHRLLSRAVKYRSRDGHVEVMAAMFENPALPDAEKLHLGFALSKALEDIGEHSEAFSYLKEANRLRRAGLEYSSEKEKKLFDDISSSITDEFYGRLNETGYPSRRSIFIVGMPRSGTTLVEQILSSQSSVFAGGEQSYFKSFISKGAEYSLQPGNDRLVEIGKLYDQSLLRFSTQSERVTDKLPINFRWLGLINLSLPHAKIVHVRRDPRDTCFSIFKNYFALGAGYDWAYDQTELGTYYALYANLMERWREVLAGRFYECDYEALVRSPEKEIKKLAEYCELAWEPAMLDFHLNRAAVRTASSVQVRNRAYTTSIGSWERHKDELAPLLRLLEPYIPAGL